MILPYINMNPPQVYTCSPSWTLGNYSFFFFFNWRIISLQNFAGFCQTSTWTSHRYTYVPSLLNFPYISLLISPLYVATDPLFEFPESYSKLILVLYCIYGNVSFHVTLSIYLTLSFPPPCVLKLFSMSVSLLPSWRKFHQYQLSRSHIWGLAWGLRQGDPGLTLGSGRFPGEGNGNPLQYSCLENSMDREAWWAIVHGVTSTMLLDSIYMR